MPPVQHCRRLHDATDEFLHCGRLEQGFLRVRCDDCHAADDPPFGEQVEKNDFPEGLDMAWTAYHLSDHTGNHIDAPFHFGPESEGKLAQKIDEVPLEWCMGPGRTAGFPDSMACLPRIANGGRG